MNPVNIFCVKESLQKLLLTRNSLVLYGAVDEENSICIKVDASSLCFISDCSTVC
jgi:hypothetical protein